MGSILSNALSEAVQWLAMGPSAPSATGPSSAPASAPAGTQGGFTPLLMGVASVGVFILAGYSIHRWARPDKLRLANAPRRHNSLQPAHIFLLFAIFLLSQWGASSILAACAGKDSQEGKILAILLSQAIWIPVVVLTGRATFRGGLARGMGLSARHWFLDGLRAAVAYLAVFPVCLLLWWAAMQFPGGRSHSLLVALPQVGAGWRLLVLFSTAVLAPVGEELFFRGLLQSMLRNHLGGPWPAVVLTAAVFAGTHAPYWHSMPALFALGVVLGYNYERTGRLLAPILIHALFNGVNVVNVLLYGPK